MTIPRTGNMPERLENAAGNMNAAMAHLLNALATAHRGKWWRAVNGIENAIQQLSSGTAERLIHEAFQEGYQQGLQAACSAEPQGEA